MRTRAVKLQNDKGNTKVLLKLTIKSYIPNIFVVLFDKCAFFEACQLKSSFIVIKCRRNVIQNFLYSTEESQSYWFSVTRGE